MTPEFKSLAQTALQTCISNCLFVNTPQHVQNSSSSFPKLINSNPDFPMPITCFNLFRPKTSSHPDNWFLLSPCQICQKSCWFYFHNRFNHFLLPSLLLLWCKYHLGTLIASHLVFLVLPLAYVYFNTTVRVSLLKIMLLCWKHCIGSHFLQNKNQSSQYDLQGSNNLLSPLSLWPHHLTTLHSVLATMALNLLST